MKFDCKIIRQLIYKQKMKYTINNSLYKKGSHKKSNKSTWTSLKWKRWCIKLRMLFQKIIHSIVVSNICAKSPVSHEVSKAPLSFISLRKETFWFDARARVFVPSIIRIFLSNCTQCKILWFLSVQFWVNS